MAETEEYFPRGGKKPQIQFKQRSNFLGAVEKAAKKKQKPQKKSEADDGYLSDEATKEVDQSYKNCAAGLNYNTVKPGVLILGRVRHVHDMKVNVMLPNRMMGTVMACHISEPYNKLLEAYINDKMEKVKELGDMFRPGQYIAVKVLEVDKDKLMLSMMPQDINGGLKQSDLYNGCVLQAAVSSVEDHGYVMDLGIPNVRAFLPKSNANPEVELDAGMVIWCGVKATEGSVVTVAASVSSLQHGVQRRPLATLLPGTAVDFTVDNPLENGIEGHVFKDVTAYIQRHHADTVKGKKPTFGQKIRARVLYVMPTRNTPFLTMRNIFETTYPDLQTEQKLQEGDIVDDAQVIKITGRSIHFKLGRGCIGTLSIKRIQVDEDLTDEEVIAKSYPIGSKHKVRVLCYNLSDYVYSVTDQPAVVNEKYFSLNQLSPGEMVTATVKTVSEAGVTLAVGRLNGYVPHAHLFDSGVFVDPKKARVSKLPKKKFKEGQVLKARILTVDLVKNSVYLTLKPSLLAPDLEVLQSYEQAEVGKAYTGVIKWVRDYVLVSFFNNVVAYVALHHVTSEPLDKLLDAFHVGQIVKCTILRVDVESQKMSGSFITAPFWPAKHPEKTDNSKNKTKDTESAHNKKRKLDPDDEHTEVEDKKKKKKKNSEETVQDETNLEPVNKKDKKSKTDKKKSNEEVVEQNIEDKKEHKKKKKKKDLESDEESKKVSEESDAIETDIQDDQVLTPQDLGLVDLTDCVTAKNYKKRVVSLLKAVKARTRRLDVVDKKIVSIEEKGLDAKNKKFHTAMHMEKLVLQERIKKLLEALSIAQEKLKTFDLDKTDYKLKQKSKEKKAEEQEKKEEKTTEVVTVEEKKTLKAKSKEIKVVESLEPALEVPSAKSFWLTTADSLAKTVQDEESSSSDEEETEQPKKKRKKLSVAEKVAKAREEEERVRELEQRALEGELQPRSSEQFERALLASPDCSQLWIAYMAFHLQATEIEKARAVARKALATISFREELERLNVWLALLNCEHRFGTKESQQKTLEDALQMNEPFKVHSKLLDILLETGKQQELSNLVDVMLRKYKREPTAYTLCGAACYKAGLVRKARYAMQKAIAVLEKKEHVSVLVQFALLERSHGERERAEALFEQVLGVYPQRVDVCCAYVDMLHKSGDIDNVRQVMERMTSYKLPARKMKVLFQKWIDVEEKLGHKSQADAIRQRAADYVAKAKF